MIILEKVLEKKNFGIPVTILTVFAYLIGYSLTRNLTGTLLVAFLFAALVFTFQFDNKVKNAVKYSYIIAVIIHLIYLVFDLFEVFISIVFGGKFTGLNSLDIYDYNEFRRVLSFLYTYGLLIVNGLVIVIFGILILKALLRNDVKIDFIDDIFAPKQPKPPVKPRPAKGQSPMHSKPVQTKPPVQPSVQAPRQVNDQTSMDTKPVQAQEVIRPQESEEDQVPVQTQTADQPQTPLKHNPERCSNCGRVNHKGAIYCASCGSKLIN